MTQFCRLNLIKTFLVHLITCLKKSFSEFRSCGPWGYPWIFEVIPFFTFWYAVFRGSRGRKELWVTFRKSVQVKCRGGGRNWSQREVLCHGKQQKKLTEMDFIILTFLKVQTRVASLKSKGLLMFEPCVLVTCFGIFILKLARDPVSTFLESIMQAS